MRAMPQYEEMKRRARKKEREAAKAAARAEEEAIGAKRQENSHPSHSEQIHTVYKRKTSATFGTVA